MSFKVNATWSGEKLKIRRKQHGLTMAELAEKVGCSRPVISQWEGNVSSPSGHLLIMLGIVLNREPKEFYTVELEGGDNNAVSDTKAG